MYDRVIVKFFKAHGPYVAGDVAGFAPEKAAKLKSVARPYDAEQEKEMEEMALKVDTSEVRAMIDTANADFAEKNADLTRREDELAKREAALDALEGGGSSAQGGNSNDPKADKGDPPQQGSKKPAAKG